MAKIPTTASVANFPPLMAPKHSGFFRATTPSPTKPKSEPVKAPVNGSGKGKATDLSMYDNLEEVEEMKKKASGFARKSLFVRDCFSRWVKKATERAAWHEAVRSGDEYRKKIQKEGLSRSSSALRTISTRPSTPLPLSEKKRRISLNGLEVSPSKKRAKKRISGEYRAPRTDDELAQRFKNVGGDLLAGVQCLIHSFFFC